MRVTGSVEIPDEELVFRYSRSSGPGGQNVNRRATKAELLFDVGSSPSLSERARSRLRRELATRIDAEGVLHVVSQSGRTQRENRERALERFRVLVAQALAPPPPPRKKTRPSRAAVEKRIAEKRRRAERKRARTRPAIED